MYIFIYISVCDFFRDPLFIYLRFHLITIARLVVLFDKVFKNIIGNNIYRFFLIILVTVSRRSVDRVESENNTTKGSIVICSFLLTQVLFLIGAPSPFSIEEISARRRGKRDEDKKLPKKVRYE
jgi:hypothetical protein